MTEFLQLAQVLADLSSLQNAVCAPSSSSSSSSSSSPSPIPVSISPSPSSLPLPLRATAALSTNPFLSLFTKQPQSHTPSTSQDPNAAQDLLTANGTVATRVRRKSKGQFLPDPPKFDKLGRRIVRGPAVGMTRSDSAGGSGSAGASTPTTTPSTEDDPDMTRAKQLIELYEMRGKFQEMGDTGLAKSTERVDKVVERLNRLRLEEREKEAKAKYLDVKK